MRGSIWTDASRQSSSTGDDVRQNGDRGCLGLGAPYAAGIVEPSLEETPAESERPLGPAVAMLGALKLVVNTAVRFVYPFLPAITRGLGIDLTQGGVLVSVRWASGLMTPVVMGFAGSAGRSRRLLMAGVVIFAAGSIVTAWTGVYVGAIVGFVLLGVAKPMIDIGAQVYVSERVAYLNRARYLGTLEIAWAGGLLVGAPLAGWLIDNWSWETPFWVVGWLGLASIGGVILLLDHNDEAVASTVSRAPDTPGRQVAMLLTVIGLFAFAHESVLIVLGSWLEGSFGLTLLALGGVGTILGLSELAGEGAMVGFTDRLGKRNSLGLGLAVACLSLVALSFVAGALVPGIAALVLAGTAIEFGYISAIPLATELRPRARSRILAWFVVANGLGRIAGDLVSPRVFERGGMSSVTLMAAGVAFLALVVLWVGVHEVDSSTSEVGV